MEPGPWYQVNIDMLSTAPLLNQGNRVRATIMGADRDNSVAPTYPDATLALKLGGEAGSAIRLPVLTS